MRSASAVEVAVEVVEVLQEESLSDWERQTVR